jgi:hypothetical protein
VDEVRGMQQTSNLSTDVKLQRKLEYAQGQVESLEAQNSRYFERNRELYAACVWQAERATRLKRKNTVLSWTLFCLVLSFFMLAGLWDVWSWGIVVGIVLGVVVIWFGSEA